MISMHVRRNTEVGTFILCDAEYLEKYGGKPKDIIKVANGDYDANIVVKNIGGLFEQGSNLKKKGLIQIRTGRLYVGDPGEPFSKMYAKWNNFLVSTNYMKKIPRTIKVINTMGDGMGEIKFTLTKKTKE